MKLSLHTSTLCRQWTDDISVYFERLKAIGFDGLEISLFGAEEPTLRAVLNKAKSMGFDIMLGTGITSQNDVSSADETVRSRGVDYLCWAADLAADVGALHINGVLYAPWQSFAAGQDAAKRMERSVQSLRRVGEYALANKIGLNCEVLNRFEGDMLNTLKQGATFVESVGLPNVKLLADTFHMNIEENDLFTAFTEHISAIGCVHICENHRGVPGTGHIDWQRLVHTLKNAEYDGYLCMETFVQSGTEVGNGLFIWHGADDEPIREIERGFRFMEQYVR